MLMSRCGYTLKGRPWLGSWPARAESNKITLKKRSFSGQGLQSRAKVVQRFVCLNLKMSFAEGAKVAHYFVHHLGAKMEL